jgi:hypothetical protein
MTPKTVPLKNRRLAALLAYLVPGLGHFYQGRYAKALLYFICIYGLYFTGLAIGEWKIVYWRWVSPISDPERFCYWYFLQALTGIVALPALIQATLQKYGFPPILWGFGADPPIAELNGLYPRLGKLVDIGYIYTQAAGLLNILAIFDAYEGPAIPETPPPPAPSPAAISATAGPEPIASPAPTQEVPPPAETRA